MTLRTQQLLHRLARVVVALEFQTKEELQQYLEDHPNADRSKHKVVPRKPKKTEKGYGGNPDVINLHEVGDLRMRNIKPKDVPFITRQINEGLAPYKDLSPENLDNFTKTDITAVIQARDWMKQDSKAENVPEELRKKLRGSIPVVEKFIQKWKNRNKGKD